MSYNKFEKEKEEFIIRKYKEYLATYRIQQFNNLTTTAPIYERCRKRVSQDYDREFPNEEASTKRSAQDFNEQDCPSNA